MRRNERAKIFIPFDPLKGFQEALRKKEREVDAGPPRALDATRFEEEDGGDAARAAAQAVEHDEGIA